MDTNGSSTAIMPLDMMQQMAQIVAKSGLFGVKTPDAALALMLISQADGMHPMQAIQRYHIIQGRPALRADAILGDFIKNGGKVKWVKRDDDCVTAVFYSAAVPDGVEVSWDMKRATAAKLTNKDNWRNYPRQMLTARVISEGVRITDPVVCRGMYTPEEVQDFAAPATETALPRAAALPQPEIVAPKETPLQEVKRVFAAQEVPFPDAEAAAQRAAAESVLPPAADTCTTKQQRYYRVLMKQLEAKRQWTATQTKQYHEKLLQAYGVAHLPELTRTQANDLIGKIEAEVQA